MDANAPPPLRPVSSATTPHAPITPIVPQQVHVLAAPVPNLIDTALPNYLLPEVIRTLQDSAKRAVEQRVAAELEAGQGQEEDVDIAALTIGGKRHGVPPKEKGKGKEAMVEDALKERIERIGYAVGGYVAEKLTLARPPLASHLDMIKFVCKDLFLFVYAKQIDNLRTNHRGVFVLQSHAFPPLATLSSTKGTQHDVAVAKLHLIYPQSLIQGALQRLGMQCTVTAETSQLPQCTFQVRVTKHRQTSEGPGHVAQESVDRRRSSVANSVMSPR